MKNIIYIILSVALFLGSCSKDPNAYKEKPTTTTVERTLTFGATFDQFVEPMATRAAGDGGVDNLIILLFDMNDVLVDIMRNNIGNTITKTLRCVPNQFYTIVYIANFYSALEDNMQLTIGTTRITDDFLTSIAPGNIIGGRKWAYGKHRKVLSALDPSVPIVATLTPKVLRVRIKLPTTENQTNKKYILWYQCKMQYAITMDGKTLKYYNGYTSSLTIFKKISDYDFFVYLMQYDPADAINLPSINIHVYNSTNNILIEDRRITVKAGTVLTIGKSYVINIVNPFPLSRSNTTTYTISEELINE